MKKYQILTIAFCVIIFLSCSDSGHGDVDNSLPQFNPQKNELTIQPNPDTTLPSSQPNVNQNNTALNPPHGEPGHDCNIAVGAPLNSGSNISTSTPAGNLPQTAKLNPPHGEPGHVCEIPVGQPLP